MNCPECGTPLGVIDSRTQKDNSIRRRRICNSCGKRYSTIEMLTEDYNHKKEVFARMKAGANESRLLEEIITVAKQRLDKKKK